MECNQNNETYKTFSTQKKSYIEGAANRYYQFLVNDVAFINEIHILRRHIFILLFRFLETATKSMHKAVQNIRADRRFTLEFSYFDNKISKQVKSG